MADSILTTQQYAFLNFVRQQNILTTNFYFTGGTCLAEYYLHHRISEDLDFFSERDIDLQALSILFKRNQPVLGYTKLDFQQAFNRNLFFLSYSHASQLKIEFTYFPFTRIDSSCVIEGLPIDSLPDIAVNKLFTLYQKPRGRDFYDLYAMHKKSAWDLKKLMELTRIKFDTYIDPLQLGRNMMQVELLKDDPLVVNQKYHYAEVISFFNTVAQSLKPEVIS